MIKNLILTAVLAFTFTGCALFSQPVDLALARQTVKNLDQLEKNIDYLIQNPTDSDAVDLVKMQLETSKAGAQELLNNAEGK